MKPDKSKEGIKTLAAFLTRNRRDATVKNYKGVPKRF